MAKLLDLNGRYVCSARHWTMIEAEAADRARRAAFDRMIRARYAPPRRGWRALLARLLDVGADLRVRPFRGQTHRSAPTIRAGRS